MAEGEVRLVWQALVHELAADRRDRTLCGKYIGTMKPYRDFDPGAADCPECKRKSKAQTRET